MSFGLLSRLCLSSIIFVFVGCGASTAVKNLVGKESSTLRFYRIDDGSEVTLYSYPNTNKLILFWNTKCGPSKRALARLDQLAQIQTNKSTVFIAANIDPNERMSEVKEVIEEYNAYSVEHMMSGNAESDQAYVRMKGENLPYLIWIDPSGVIKAADIDDEEVISQFKNRVE